MLALKVEWLNEGKTSEYGTLEITQPSALTYVMKMSHCRRFKDVYIMSLDVQVWNERRYDVVYSLGKKAIKLKFP